MAPSQLPSGLSRVDHEACGFQGNADQQHTTLTVVLGRVMGMAEQFPRSALGAVATRLEARSFARRPRWRLESARKLHSQASLSTPTWYHKNGRRSQ